jgi:hypothetical protein
MGAIGGKTGKVIYGSVVIANIKQWSLSGFTQAVAEVSAFGSDIKSYLPVEGGEPGTISFTGNCDPADSAGQRALSLIKNLGLGLTNLYLYSNTSTFWRVGAGGCIYVTKADAVTLARNAIGTIDFEGKVSGAAMEQVGTGL